jgi:hypothetical protein
MIGTSKNIWDFDPRSVPGCQVWFDGADRSTITGSSTVTAWKDKSRNGWNATTLIGTAPTNTTVNGNNAVSFSGQSTLTVSNVTFSSVQSRAIFVVYRVVTSGSYISWFGTQAFNINNQGGHNNLVLPTGGGGPYLQSYAVGGAVQGMGADPAVSTIGTTAIACMIHSAVSTSNNVVTLNGTSYALSTNTLASGYGSGTVTYYIGNAYPQAYILCEYILYQEEFTVAQRQQVEGYLAHKWGIKTSIPVTHPFRSIRPFLRQFNPVDIQGCELWFDGADFKTMFQNTAGTTPVTAASQSVACWKDKVRNLSVTDTGISGRASVAPTSLSGGGLFFTNVSASPTSNTRSLGAFSSGATNQTSFLFRMPTKSMTMFTVCLPLSNNGYRRICLMGSTPLSGGPPNFLIGPQMGASEGGTILVDLNAGMSAWGQEYGTSSYNSNAILRIDSLTIGTTGSWFTNGTSNTPSTNTSYTSSNTNYPVNYLYIAGYSDTIDGGRCFNGNIYEILLYSKALTTSERQLVEGYLAYKWGIRSSIPATHPFKTFSSSSALPFLPTNISACVLWLDPADRSTVTLSGSNVSQLNDKSGLGYNMSQATSGNQPTYASSLYGNGMLTFTQSLSTRLSNTSFPTFIGSGPASYFLVEYNMTAPSGNPGPFGYSAGPNFGLIMQYNPGFTGGLQPFSTGVSSFTSATPRLIFLYKPNVTSSNMTGFINGTSQTVSDTTSGTYSGTFSVGSATNGFISGNICELIVFNKDVTTSERQQVEGYLAYKWGLTSSLPSTHPYIKFQPAQTRIIVPSTIATVTLSSLSASGGTITWLTSTNAVSYNWYVGTTFPTALVSGTVGDVLTTSVSFAFVASTNYIAWVIPVSSTGTDGATTQSATASYSASANITSANLNTIATYLRSYMSEFRNPSFYGYNLDGNSYFISDGGGDMYDQGNWTYPWLITGQQFTTATGSQQLFSINYSSTTATTVDTDFVYASLGYATSSGGSITSNHPLTVLGFRSTVGRSVGFQISGNSGADGAGTLASGILYAGTTLSGFTVHAFYRETYNAGDPSHCNLFILLGHTNWGSVFGTINSFADPVNQGGNGAFFYTSGASVKNILAVQTLLSKSGGALVTSAECQTVVQAFANRIKLALGF